MQTGQNLKAERAASFKNSGVQKLDGFFSEVDSDSVTFSGQFHLPIISEILVF